MPKIPAHAERVFAGVLFEVWQWQQPMFDGSTATFEMLRRPDTAVVLPVIAGKILLIEQRQPHKPEPFLSLPGGRFEPGDTAELAAARELAEETGYRARELEPWLALQPIGKIDWTIHYFIGHGCEQIGAQQLDGGEEIRPRLVSLEEFLELANEPRFAERELAAELAKLRLDPIARAAFAARIGIGEM